MPGGNVVTGILRQSYFADGIPKWMPLSGARKRSGSFERVFLYSPASHAQFSKANIGTIFHRRNNPGIQGYRCFVKTDNGVLKADLRQLPLGEEVRWPNTAHIYVRIPGYNIIYMGQLRYLARQNAPNWIRSYTNI